MAKKTVSDLSKSGQVNSFTGGINTDLHPMLQPNDTLTDCLNGTLITYNGNENMLQNDMGNYELKNAKLPAGYIPMGMKEHQGILYMILMNPVTKRVEIGTYPSPKTDFGTLSNKEEYVLKPVEIGTLDEVISALYEGSSDSTSNVDLSEIIWKIIDGGSEIEDIKNKVLYTKLDTSKSSIIFTKDFDQNSMLTNGDEYSLSKDFENELYESNPPYQTLKYFTINKENEVSDVENSKVYINEGDSYVDGEETLNNVAWDSNGWLGAEFKVEEAGLINQNISGTIYNVIGKPSVSNYKKISNVSSDSDGSDFTYSFEIDNFITDNKIVDFKKYVEEHKNNMVIVEGLYSFDNSEIRIIEKVGNYFGVLSKINISEYKLASNQVPSFTHAVANELTNSFYKNALITNYYVINHLDLSKIEDKEQTIHLGPNTVISGTFPSDINSKVTFSYKESFEFENKIPASVENKIVHHKWTNYPEGITSAFDLSLSDTECALYAEYVGDEDIKIGLNGEFEYGVYIVNDLDSSKALKEFIGTLNDCDIILPNNLKIYNLPRGNNYILPYQDVEDSIHIYPGSLVYTDNKDINLVIHSISADESVIVPKTIIQSTNALPIFMYQFPSIELTLSGINDKINNASKVINAELVNDDTLKLNVTISKAFDSAVDLYKKSSNWSEFANSIKGDVLNNAIIYMSESKLPDDLEYTNQTVVKHAFYEKEHLGFITFSADPTGAVNFGKNTDLKAIILPKTITVIEKDAFADCTSLSQIEFGGVTKIYDSAFENCTSLIDVQIKDIEYVGANVFSIADDNYTVTRKFNFVNWTAEIMEGFFGTHPIELTISGTIPTLGYVFSDVNIIGAGSTVYFSECRYGNEYNLNIGSYAIAHTKGWIETATCNYEIIYPKVCTFQYKNESQIEWTYPGQKLGGECPWVSHTFNNRIGTFKFSEPITKLEGINWGTDCPTDLFFYPKTELTITSSFNMGSEEIPTLTNITFEVVDYKNKGKVYINNSFKGHTVGIAADLKTYSEFVIDVESFDKFNGTIYIPKSESSITSISGKAYEQKLYDEYSIRVYTRTQYAESVSVNQCLEKVVGASSGMLYKNVYFYFSSPVGCLNNDFSINVPAGYKINELEKIYFPETPISIGDNVKIPIRISNLYADSVGSNSLCDTVIGKLTLCSKTSIGDDSFKNTTIDELFIEDSISVSENSFDRSTISKCRIDDAYFDSMFEKLECNPLFYTEKLTSQNMLFAGDAKNNHIYKHFNTSVLYKNNASTIYGANNIILLDNFVDTKLLIPENAEYSIFVNETQYYGNSTNGVYFSNAALAYAYLFDDFTLKAKINTWYKNSEGFGSIKTLTIGETSGSVFEGKLFTSNVENRYIVPESFKGNIVSDERVFIDNKPWNENMKQVLYEIVQQNELVPAVVQISVTAPKGLKVATKVVENDTKYYDLSAGNAVHNYNTLLNPLTKVDIKSVPYKIETFGGKDYLLIYDNLIQEDSLNYSDSADLKIVKFQYKHDQSLYVDIEINDDMNYDEVIGSASLYKVDKGVFVPIATTITRVNAGEFNSGDRLEMNIEYTVPEDNFVFLKLMLDVNSEVMLPICTKIDSKKWDEWKAAGLLESRPDFSKLYLNDLINFEKKEVVVSDNSTVENKYITCTLNQDNTISSVIAESNMPYYWYNGIKNSNSSVDDGEDIASRYYFGKGSRMVSKINLSELGIKEGNIIDISGIPNKIYRNIQVNVKNTELFSKENGNIYLHINMLSNYTLFGYDVTSSNSAIPVRKYLIKHCAPPITHNEHDLGWENKPINEYTGWSGDNALSYNQLYVTKSDACNNNVQINVVSASPESYDEKSGAFKKGPTMTNSSQINNAIRQATERQIGNNSPETKQLFTIVKAKLDTDDGGFTLPVPRMKNGVYEMNWTPNKKNKGTSSSVVLKRDSGGLGWINQLKNSIAYIGISGGIAGVATTVVLGCVAAFGAAAAGASAALAAIPFVGWAVLAAAVIAASIYLLCKATAGVNQDFEFFTIKGSPNRPLVIPLWGKHLGKRGKDQSEHTDRQWHMRNGISNKFGHPWYFDPNFTHAEELITLLMTHIYYYAEGPKLQLGNMVDVVSVKESPITITVNTQESSLFGVDKYLQISNQIYDTNNFKLLQSNTPTVFVITIQSVNNSETIDGSDWVSSQKDFVENKNSDQVYYIDNNIKVSGWNAISEELDSFVCNLGGSGPDVHYNDVHVRSNIQDAFGGNSGGRRCKFRSLMYSSFDGYYKMIDGEFPKNDLEYTPIAYGVGAQEPDKIMVKDLGWNDSYLDIENGNSILIDTSKDNWGVSNSQYQKSETEFVHGSKYLDFIKWDSYSEEFKLTCNTNDL